MRSVCLAFALFLLSQVSFAVARTWYVNPSGSGDFTDIQPAIDAANPGDDVLVAASDYREDIYMKSGIWLHSELGPLVTIVRGWEFGGNGILTCENVDSTSVIAGFTFTEGRYNGIYLIYSSPTVRNCVVTDNPEWGIYCGGGYPLITDCLISNNDRAGIAVQGPPRIENCQIVNNRCGIILHFGCANAQITGCLIANNSNVGCSSICGGPHYGETAYVQDCTIVNNHTDTLSVFACFNMNVSNTIIAYNEGDTTVSCHYPLVVPIFECCDIFGNSGGDWLYCIADQYGINGNFSEDPLFCDPDTCFYLQPGSPCISHGGCGQVGAYGEGCWNCGGPSYDSLSGYAFADANLNGQYDSELEDAIDNVDVTINGPSGTLVTQTNPEGYYEFQAIQTGDYSLTAEKEGYQTTYLDSVEVQGGKATKEIPMHFIPDLYVLHMSSSQAIETDSLVANRTTVIRIWVATGNAAQSDSVTGRLIVERDGAEIPGSPFTPNPFQVTATNNYYIDHDDRTLNFYFKPPEGILDITVIIDPDNEIQEYDESNNSLSIQRVVIFKERLNILACRVRCLEFSGQYTGPNPEHLKAPLMLVKKCYPLADDGLSTFTWIPDLISARCKIYTRWRWKYFIEELKDLLSTKIDEDGDFFNILLGFLPMEAMEWQGGGGLNPTGDNLRGVAIVNDAFYEPKSYVKAIVAHELAHEWNPGKEEEHYRKDEVGHLPPHFCSTKQVGEGAFDVFDRHVIPSNHNSLMGACHDDVTWIIKDTWDKLFRKMEPPLVNRLEKSGVKYLYISAVVDSSDSVLSCSSVMMNNDVAPDTLSEGSYRIVCEDAQGSVLNTRRFEAVFEADDVSDSLDIGVFALTTEYPDSAKSVLILHNDVEIWRITASENYPSIQVLNPNGGEFWDGVHNVSWDAIDTDSLQYSWEAEELVGEPDSRVHGTRTIAVDQNGNAHAVSYSGTGEIKYSEWDGVGWSSEIVIANGQCPTISCDSYGDVHVVYYNPVDQLLWWIWRDSGIWQPPAGIDAFGGKPDLVADGVGNLHLAWENGEKIYYRMWDGISWGLNPIQIVSTTVASSIQPSIAASFNGEDVFVSWTGDDGGVSKIYYREAISGLWQDYEEISDNLDSDISFYSISIDENSGVKQVVWSQSKSGCCDSVVYRSKTSSLWNDKEAIAGDLEGKIKASCIRVSDAGDVYVAWAGENESGDPTIYLKTNLAGEWSEELLVSECALGCLGSDYPSMAIGPDGRAHFIYQYYVDPMNYQLNHRSLMMEYDISGLEYSILYTPDGSNWTPIATGINETTYEFDTTQIAGGENCLVKVIVSDGINTAEDKSDAAFTVVRKPPTVTIISPADSSTMVATRPSPLLASGYDPEDGMLDDTNFSWSSDIDGILGTGASVYLDSITPGGHTITVTGEDNDFNSDQEAIYVTVYPDGENDGMPDFWEDMFVATDMYNDDAVIDWDLDELINLHEYEYQTDPGNPDTDGDGLPDGYEVRMGSDPSDSTSIVTAVPVSPGSDEEVAEGDRLEIITNWQSYPNPFNPRTNVNFNLSRDSKVKLKIYDVRGRLVNTLISGQVKAGSHVVVWDGMDRKGRGVASGVYFARLEVNDKAYTKKMLLLR